MLKNKNFVENVDLRIPTKKIYHELYQTDNINSLNYFLKKQYKYHVIYIDPPYNTKTGGKTYDDNKNQNKWENDIKKRLKISKKLLKEDGFIAINIGIDQLIELGLICDLIFTKKNRISILVRKTTPYGQKTRYISNNIDFIYIYAKNRLKLKITNNVEINKKKISKNLWVKLSQNSFGYSKKRDYQITINNKHYYANSVTKKIWKERILNTRKGEKQYSWALNKKEYRKLRSEKKIKIENNCIKYQKKQSEIKKRHKDCWLTKFKYSNQHATIELGKLFTDKKIKFSYPKPVELIKWIIGLHPNKNALVLDFYAGSGTTLHSVLEKNAKDKGKRIGTICIKKENGIEKETYKRLKTILFGNNKIKTKWEIGRDPYEDGLKFYEPI